MESGESGESSDISESSHAQVSVLSSQAPVDKPSLLDIGPTMDFSMLVRTKVAKEHKDHDTVGLEVRRGGDNLMILL